LELTLKKPDTVLSVDSSGRRRFIRTGSAFLLAGSTAAHSQEDSFPARSDCDQSGAGEAKDTEAAMSDSDSGSTADRQGCATKKTPAITQWGVRGRGRTTTSS